MSAFMVDSTIGPIPVVSDELIVTDRARARLVEDDWLPPSVTAKLRELIERSTPFHLNHDGEVGWLDAMGHLEDALDNP